MGPVPKPDSDWAPGITATVLGRRCLFLLHPSGRLWFGYCIDYVPRPDTLKEFILFAKGRTLADTELALEEKLSRLLES